MQRVQAQPAFVLHAQPYRETSLLIEAFTRDYGRVGLIARGARGARAHSTRALLQPLQPLHLSWAGRGELGQVSATEAAGPALTTQGEGLLATFYLNELLMRLLPRGEAQASLFWRYTQCLAALQSGPVAWELRRFERDLLAELGYGLVLDVEADGVTPLDPEALYTYEPERGALRVAAHKEAVAGASLLALARDQAPDAVALRELRALMRRVLLHHLGGRELRSWQLLSDLAAHKPRS